MKLSDLPPLIRPAVTHLFDAEEASRAARRLISPAGEHVTEAVAHTAIDKMSEAIGQLVAARAELARAYPNAAEGIEP